MKTMRLVSRAFCAAAVAAASISCGSVVRDSRSPVLLVIDTLQGVKGAVTPGAPLANLSSDVLTLVTSGGVCTTASPCPTIFDDAGQASMHIILKDIGQPGVTVNPSTNNEVTVTRVHVSYRRTDGRNQEGIDVPYAFDTATTATITSTSAVTLGFILVRQQAKTEMPLVALVSNGQVLSTIADVTFYGADAVGNTLSVTGSIGIQFANFGDQ